MEHIDDMILNAVSNNFKTVRQLSDELKIPYVRIAVRIKQLRKRNSLISIRASNTESRGVKPLKYKKKT